MTQAVMIIIVILAILLSLHIFIIVWLLWQQHGKKSLVQTDHAYLVVYSRQSGHAESWAKHTVEQLQLIHQQGTLKNIQKLTINDLTQ